MNPELSLTSVDTMSYTSDTHTDSHGVTSSAPTTTHSSPQPADFANDKPHSTIISMTHSSNETLQLPASDRYKFQEESPDLMQSGFYNSESLKDHAQTVRKSMVVSDSMTSVRISDERTGMAMTNSPSFSALASILEKKQAIVGNRQVMKKANLLSPNLIQLDDIPDLEKASSSQQHTNTDDIFKTPEIRQPQSFTSQSSMLESFKEEEEAEEEVKESPNFNVVGFSPAKDQDVTPLLTKPPTLTDIGSIRSPQSMVRKPPALSPDSPHFSIPKYSPVNHNIQSIKPQPLPKKSPQIAQNYAQRSSSMPVITLENSKTDTNGPNKKRSFLSFFKSKRSVSGSAVPQMKPQTKPHPEPKAKPQSLKPMKSSQSFQLAKATQQQPRVAQRSTSSTSLFSAFKRSKKADLEDLHPALAPEPISQHKQLDNDDMQSFSSDEGFNEDFNQLRVETPQMPTPTITIDHTPTVMETKRHSQISQGETLFPKKLSAQDVESIVSLERNRSLSRQSVISRRQSQSSNRPMSLVEAIESNAREEGMYIEQAIPRRPSLGSLSQSIQQSPKNLSDYFPDHETTEDKEELFNVEEFSRNLEFDGLADSYNDDDDNDVSEFMEFADFIDFGGDLELSFDMEETSSTPLSQPPLNSISSTAVQSPTLRSPPLSLQSLKFDNAPSPRTSPFLQQSSFVPSMARPISMSFRGLKAPAFQTFHESNSNTSLVSSTAPSQSTSDLHVNQKERRVMFSSKITLYDVYAEDEYDRKPDVATCNQLTPQLAQEIRAELNQMKSEMVVHESSRCYTLFF